MHKELDIVWQLWPIITVVFMWVISSKLSSRQNPIYSKYPEQIVRLQIQSLLMGLGLSLLLLFLSLFVVSLFLGV